MLSLLKSSHGQEKFANAFQKCQENAWASVRRLRTKTLPILTKRKRLNPLIQPGSTVRIWSTETIPKSLSDILRYRGFWDCKTVPVHLCVEIIPRRMHALENISFSFGYGHDPDDGSQLDDTLIYSVAKSFKRPEDNKFKQLRGLVLTPDPALNDKLEKQHGNQKNLLYLVSIGRLTQKHIDSLQQIIQNSLKIHSYERGSYFTIESPKYAAFREYSSQAGQTRNCTSFVLDIFYDMLQCRGASYFIANPAWCRAKNLSDDFPGCDENGIILSIDKEAPRAKDQLDANGDVGLGAQSSEPGRASKKRPFDEVKLDRAIKRRAPMNFRAPSRFFTSSKTPSQASDTSVSA
jgi:hypothetical protein